MKKVILSLSVLLLSGCFASNMVKLSPDTYMIRVEDHAGIFAFNRGNLKPDAIRQANEFAESKNKVAIPISMETHPVGILGDWPAVEYQFRVVDKNDPEARRTSLVPRADITIDRNEKISADIRNENISKDKPDFYTELIKLDDLRKKGLITDNEFESEKQKLLRRTE